MEGVPVTEAEVSKGLGFSSIEEFRAWAAAGHPTGRCSNEHCYRPAFWPDLDKPCKYCGNPIKIDKGGESNDVQT